MAWSTVAPSASGGFATSRCPTLLLVRRGVKPSLVAWSPTSAPLAGSSFATSLWPRPLLKMGGVTPLFSAWFTYAPLASSSFTTSPVSFVPWGAYKVR